MDDLNTGRQVGKCAMSYGPAKWSIVEWFVDGFYKHQGIGKHLMKLLMEDLIKDTGKPKEITYTWNGENEYVRDWLERNFDAECEEDVNASKYKAEYSKDAHLFKLNVDMVFEYFGLQE